MKEPILSVANVSIHFGGVAAVVDMSFDVGPGEALGLMGPNGAGKSTLLNSISGQRKPNSGTVVFRGHNIVGLPAHHICRLGIGRTYQIPQPFVNLTVLQNLLVAGQYGRGLRQTLAESEAVRILRMVDLLDKRDVFTRDLSAITLKRLELARALATKPSLLLLDEVAAGLTEEETPRVLEILQTVREMGITYIIIEHVMRVMVKAVDRIIVMDKGAKIAEGAPKDVTKDKGVIEAYLGKSHS
jgi:branched-chain amino acid transport system ATP-binding protein